MFFHVPRPQQKKIQVFNLMNFREELQEELMNLDVGKVLAPEKANQIGKRKLHQWMERFFLPDKVSLQLLNNGYCGFKSTNMGIIGFDVRRFYSLVKSSLGTNGS